MRIIDITPRIGPALAVFPGDVKFQRHVAMDMRRGDHLTLSSITATLHLGAHADAPNHYHADGTDIAQRDLSYYIGRCQVVHFLDLPKNGRVTRDQWGDRKVEAPRVLFRTSSFPDPNHWEPGFASICPDLVQTLAMQGVRLIGIDTPSIDPGESKKMESHHVIRSHDMAILEGLVLDHVSEGMYSLIALPLPIEGGDASPVRAVLLENPWLFTADTRGDS